MATLLELLKKIKANPAVLAIIPAENGMGIPTFSIRKEELCVNIPFFREHYIPDDKTLIYPFSYIVTALWDSGRIIDIYKTDYSREFYSVQTNRPVGTFRHEAVKHLSKKQYKELKYELYAEYDKLAEALTTDIEYRLEDEQKLVTLLNQLIEPSLKQFYKVLDPDFSKRFFVGEV